jgi:hypothetical protein
MILLIAGGYSGSLVLLSNGAVAMQKALDASTEETIFAFGGKKCAELSPAFRNQAARVRLRTIRELYTTARKKRRNCMICWLIISNGNRKRRFSWWSRE